MFRKKMSGLYNQPQDPWKTPVLIDRIMVNYVPLRLERSASAS